MNEEPPLELFLDLTLTQHLHDENLELWEVRPHFEVEPPQAWYYNISLNFRTLMILLQVDFASSDELKIVCESCYKIKNNFIFAWSSIFNVGHYCWLCDPICWLLLNSKTNYLVCTIRHILDFLQLWTITMASPMTKHVIVAPHWTYPWSE